MTLNALSVVSECIHPSAFIPTICVSANFSLKSLPSLLTFLRVLVITVGLIFAQLSVCSLVCHLPAFFVGASHPARLTDLNNKYLASSSASRTYKLTDPCITKEEINAHFFPLNLSGQPKICSRDFKCLTQSWLRYYKVHLKDRCGPCFQFYQLL